MNSRVNPTAVPYSGTCREKRQHQRHAVKTRINLAIEDESRGEPVGLAEAVDMGLGGVRMQRLPAHVAMEVGSRLQLLLIDADHMLSLRGEVVHDDMRNGMRVKFTELSAVEQQDMSSLLSDLKG